MNRRDLLKAFCGIPAVIGMGGPLSLRSIVRGIEQSPPPTEDVSLCDYFHVDINGHIRYTGQPNGPIFSVLDFHRFVADRFDDYDMIVHPNPTDRITDQIISFNSDLPLDPDIPRHLTGGTLIYGNTVWANIVEIGDE